MFKTDKAVKSKPQCIESIDHSAPLRSAPLNMVLIETDRAGRWGRRHGVIVLLDVVNRRGEQVAVAVGRCHLGGQGRVEAGEKLLRGGNQRRHGVLLPARGRHGDGSSDLGCGGHCD